MEDGNAAPAEKDIFSRLTEENIAEAADAYCAKYARQIEDLIKVRRAADLVEAARGPRERIAAVEAELEKVNAEIAEMTATMQEPVAATAQTTDSILAAREGKLDTASFSGKGVAKWLKEGTFEANVRSFFNRIRNMKGNVESLIAKRKALQEQLDAFMLTGSDIVWNYETAVSNLRISELDTGLALSALKQFVLSAEGEERAARNARIEKLMADNPEFARINAQISKGEGAFDAWIAEQAAKAEA